MKGKKWWGMDEKSRVIKLKEVKKSKLFTLLINIKSGYQYRHDRSIDRQTDRKTGRLTKKFHS